MNARCDHSTKTNRELYGVSLSTLEKYLCGVIIIDSHNNINNLFLFNYSETFHNL